MSDNGVGLRKAMEQGRAARVGARNPYVGQGGTATAWNLGYQAMLADMVATRSSGR